MTRILRLGCAALAFAPLAAAGVIADLNSDFSTSTNAPNGWSYNQGTSQLVYVTNWAGYNNGQGAWVPNDGASTNTNGSFLPAVLQADQTYDTDFQLGDIGIHSWDVFNGGSNGVGNVTWTSTVTASVQISGTVWDTGVSRDNNYALLLNGSTLTSGGVAAGVNNRANPVSFSFIESVTTGEVLEMDITSSCPTCAGAVAGITLDISTAAPAPEPSGLLLCTIGAGMLGIVRLTRRR